jgi:predicted PurR-regulated permease PerM
MRFPFPLAIGVLEGLVVALPYVGTFFGVLTAGAVAFALQGWLPAAETVAFVALVHTLEGTFVGIAGIILAVPTVAVVQTILAERFGP